jgi:hypothetical protein
VDLTTSSQNQDEQEDRTQSMSNLSSSSVCDTACNANGPKNLAARFRSVLCHRLGLPLVHALHGEDPTTLDYLGQESRFCSDEKKNLYADI